MSRLQIMIEAISVLAEILLWVDHSVSCASTASNSFFS